MAGNNRRQADADARAVVAGQAQPQQTALVSLADANKALEADLDRRDDELARKLSGSFPPDYFIGLVLTQVRKWEPADQLALASTAQGRASLVAAMYQAAELHLPFLMGRMWLVPYRNSGVLEAQAQVGYQGLVDLITAPGTDVTYIEAAVVRRRDQFDYMRGTGGYLRHREYLPDLDDASVQTDLVYDRGPVTFAWARVVYANGQDRWDVMTYAELEAIRLQAKTQKVWTSHPDEMRKKTVLRRLAKTQRISLDAMRVIEREDDWEAARAAAAQPVQDDQQALRQRLQVRAGGVPPQTAQDGQQATVAAGGGDPGPAPGSVAAAPATAPEPAQTQPQDAAAGGPTAQTAATCGATLQDDDAVYTCGLAPRHRGVHSDGQHDWPQGM